LEQRSIQGRAAVARGEAAVGACPGSVITSKDNPQVKAIRRLAARSGREERQRFFVEGARFVCAAADAGLLELLVTSPNEIADAGRWQRLAERAGARSLRVSGRVYASLSRTDDPPWVGGVVRLPAAAHPAADDTGLCVAVAGCEFPGNLGTIIRSCEGVGASALYCIGRETDPFHPACVRATMGSIFRVPLVPMEWRSFALMQRRAGRRIIGASPAGHISYREAEFNGPIVLLLGAERPGLTEEQLRACDTVVRIPMAGRLDSLNLAVAAGVLMCEAFARNRKRPAASA
jgi:RNA methyltransferase, TrmH family